MQVDGRVACRPLIGCSPLGPTERLTEALRYVPGCSCLRWAASSRQGQQHQRRFRSNPPATASSSSPPARAPWHDIAQPFEMADRTASPPSLPPEAIEAITSKAPDAPRRCFICLTDASPSDPPNTWVDPCPCTLEAHQDCILSWVTDCERSNKPLRCPVCKSDIVMEGQWDPIVSLHDYVVKRFTRGSPWILMSGLTFGLASGLQMYGAASIALFAGREALLQMMLGDERTVDVTVPTGFTAERLRNGLFMMQIGPTLLMHRIFPSLVDTIVSPQVLLVCLVPPLGGLGF